MGKCRTNQTLVDNTRPQQERTEAVGPPQYKAIAMGHVSHAGPCGVGGMMAKVAIPNVATSERTQNEIDSTWAISYLNFYNKLSHFTKFYKIYGHHGKYLYSCQLPLLIDNASAG